MSGEVGLKQSLGLFTLLIHTQVPALPQFPLNPLSIAGSQVPY